jgi:hypothetical protein
MMGRGSRRFKRRHEMSNAVDSRAALLMSGENGCGAMTDLKTLYEEDTVAWAENQAAALRAAAQDGSNQELDWENLAEEIEDLGKSRRHELHSRIRTVVEHLVKLEYSPAVLPRNDWRDSIQHARIEIDALLEESPSLRPRLDGIISTEIPRGAKLAIRSLEDHQELASSLQQDLKAKSYLELFAYTPDQILGDWFPDEPKS